MAKRNDQKLPMSPLLEQILANQENRKMPVPSTPALETPASTSSWWTWPRITATSACVLMGLFIGYDAWTKYGPAFPLRSYPPLPPSWCDGEWQGEWEGKKQVRLTLAYNQGELRFSEGGSARGEAVTIRESYGERALLAINDQDGQFLLVKDEAGNLALYKLREIGYGKRYQLKPMSTERTVYYPNDLSQHQRLALFKKGGGP